MKRGYSGQQKVVKQRLSVPGSLCTALFCVCGTANLPSAAAVAPNPWAQRGQPVAPTGEADDSAQPDANDHHHIHASPVAPNQTSVPADPVNPTIVVPD